MPQQQQLESVESAAAAAAALAAVAVAALAVEEGEEIRTTTTTTTPPWQHSPRSSRHSHNHSHNHSHSHSLTSSHQTTDISKHYAVNNQILAAFESLYNANGSGTATATANGTGSTITITQGNGEQQTQQHAGHQQQQQQYRSFVLYAVGLQFVETALLEIPRHGYYYSRRPQHETARLQSALEAVRVTQLLQKMQADYVEDVRNVRDSNDNNDNNDNDNENNSNNNSDNNNNSNSNNNDRIQKLATLALEEVEQASQDQYESQRQRQQAEAEGGGDGDGGGGGSVHDSWSSSVCANPLTACDSLSSMLFGSSSVSVSALASALASASAASVLASAVSGDGIGNIGGGSIIGKTRSTRDLLLDDDDNDNDYLHHSVSSVPGTLPLKRASFMSLSEEMALEKALYLSGLEAAMADSVLDWDMEEYQQEQGQPQEEEQQRIQPSPTTTTITPAVTATATASTARHHHSRHRRRPSSARIGLQVLARLYAEDFDSLVQSRRVRISFIRTYQGRVPASTNGCTVIAPVLCMHHLLNDDDIDMDMDMDMNIDMNMANNGGGGNSSRHGHGHGHRLRPDPGLPDVTILHVIDAETPAILSELRHQLRLAPAAFLIPSDVHDYLIGNGQLAPEQFVAVTGGNILDDEHLQSLVNILACTETTTTTTTETTTTTATSSDKRSTDNSNGSERSKDDNDNTNGSGSGSGGNGNGNSNHPMDSRRKLAATLFFHEHVVAILKMRRDDDTVWYDVIDSLPSRETLARPDESEYEFRQRLSLGNSLSRDDSSSTSMLDDASFIPKTARIRCLNAEALKAYLRWYACSKFGEENVSYIDMYAWDDSQSDFDPRVFQAFVWGDARECSKV